MKILYLTHRFFPESHTVAAQVTLNLPKMMQRFGHRVKVVAYSFLEPAAFNRSIGKLALREFVYDGVPVLALRHQRIPQHLHTALEDPELAAVAGDLLRRERPDIVHVCHLSGVGELLAAARLSGIPYVVTLTDYFLICPKSTLIRSDGALCSGPDAGGACRLYCREVPDEIVLGRSAKAMEWLRAARAVCASSASIAAVFQQELGRSDVEVLPPGVSQAGFKGNTRTYRKGDSIAFGYFGSLESTDSCRALIEAFRTVCSERATLKIYGGENPERNGSLLDGIANGDQRIELGGVYTLEQFRVAASGIDAIVVPSLRTSVDTIAATQALDAGIPVIAPTDGNAASAVQPAETGFVFGTKSSLAEVFQTIVDQPEVLNPIKERIRRMVFPTVEQEAFAYERIYRTFAH